jgi:hypothetical protein
MDCFCEWQEIDFIPNQDASTVADASLFNFCHFGILRELQSNQGQNLESQLMQEVLQHLGKIGHGPSLISTVRQYGGTICEDGCEAHKEGQFCAPEELRQEDTRFRAGLSSITHETTGYTPASIMFGREQCCRI